MKKNVILIFALFTLVVISIGCEDGISDPPPNGNFELTKSESSVLESSGNFGLNLFADIVQNATEKNVFISPLSISTALGMALNGAEGETYNEMLNILTLQGLSLEEINNANNTLLNLLTEIDTKVNFKFANSCWYDNSFNIEADFIEKLKKYYEAEVSKVALTDPLTKNIINSWVNEKTNGKIEEIIDEISADVVMYLINALYFKADWKYKFDKSKTVLKEFKAFNKTDIQTEMMQTENKFKYYQNSDLQAVDLPYGDGTYAMTVILPNQNISVNDLALNFTNSYWQSIINGMQAKHIHLFLPKFEYEYKIELKNILQQMGMKKAFSGDAEFTKIIKTDKIQISRILHKTYVDVNEEGTEAAAVTAVEFEATSVSNMEVNRPFIFAIRELSTNTIIFIGKVENPKSNDK